MGKKILRSEVCGMLGVEYPILLAGMGAVPGMPRTGKYYTGTSVELVAAVSNAGGFGVLGAAELSPEQILEAVKKIHPKGLSPLTYSVRQVLQDFAGKEGSILLDRFSHNRGSLTFLRGNKNSIVTLLLENLLPSFINLQGHQICFINNKYYFFPFFSCKFFYFRGSCEVGKSCI